MCLRVINIPAASDICSGKALEIETKRETQRKDLSAPVSSAGS